MDRGEEIRRCAITQGRRTFLAACLLAATCGCAFLLGGTVDYVFSAGGVVTDDTGAGLDGVLVTLEVGEVVYQGTSAIRTQSHTTGPSGGFRFQYISHRRNVPYVLRFTKPGYATRTIKGASPPSKDVAVTLLPMDDAKGRDGE